MNDMLSPRPRLFLCLYGGEWFTVICSPIVAPVGCCGRWLCYYEAQNAEYASSKATTALVALMLNASVGREV